MRANDKAKFLKMVKNGYLCYLIALLQQIKPKRTLNKNPPSVLRLTPESESAQKRVSRPCSEGPLL